MTRLALIATILMVATGCDKAKDLAGRQGQTAAVEPPASERFALARKPDVLFQVFGERDDPRMIPIAAVEGGTLKTIALGSAGWRSFDSLYTRAGASYTVYRDGRAAGTVTVRRGMWDTPDAPIYSLPRCQLLRPLAAVTVAGVDNSGYTVEFLASSATFASRPPGKAMDRNAAIASGKTVAYAVGKTAGLERARLDSLDFYGVAIQTGATADPTLIASFIDPGAGDEKDSESRSAHVVVIADRKGAAYEPTCTQSVNGATSSAAFRRYLDHLDINGDGVDEIIVEGWQYGGDTQLIALAYRGGRWEEVFRGPPSWCLDPK